MTAPDVVKSPFSACSPARSQPVVESRDRAFASIGRMRAVRARVDLDRARPLTHFPADE